jgi:hypothetical protein
MMDWTTMSETQRFQTLRSMLLRGGGFAQALATAWMRADSGNSDRLAEAFPDLILKYGPESHFYVG